MFLQILCYIWTEKHGSTTRLKGHTLVFILITQLNEVGNIDHMLKTTKCYDPNITLSFLPQTPKQLNKEYKRRIKELNYTYNTYSAFAYDAVWSIALMLDQSEALLQKRNSSLKELAFGNKEASEIFVRLLNRTNFPGMSVSPVIHIRKFYFNCNNFKYFFNSICIYYCTTCRIFRKVLISMEFLFFFMIIQKMSKLPVRTL